MKLDLLKTPRFGVIALIVVHFFGVVGILSPLSDLFLVMTPLTLGLSFLALVYTQARMSVAQKISILAIGLLGYGVEVLGVWTGFPFGEYAYGPVLGPHLFAVPPMIGINWILVVLAASAVSARLASSLKLRVVIAAALMTGFDWVLEPVAVVLDFWTWGYGLESEVDGHAIPLSNYAAWFVLSLIFCALWQRTAHARLTQDKTSFALFWIQLAFFGALRLMLS
ncbi:MAG: carotenoid biosynthesis protein [Opitutales bacterium]